MKKKIKSGLLILLLAGPLFVFISFHFFGTNHYNVPFYYPIQVSDNGDTVFYQVKDFNIRSVSGEVVNKNTFQNKLFVVNFFTGTIEDSAINMVKNLPYLQNSFRNHPEVQFLSIYIGNTNPTELQQYTQVVGAKDSVWYVGQGIEEVKTDVFKQDASQEDNTLLLVDTNYHIRAVFDGNNPKKAEELLSLIRILLYEQY